MAETTTETVEQEPTYWAVAGSSRYPMLSRYDLTGRQIDWIERKCGKSYEEASEENRHVFTQAYVSVCIAEADPTKKLDEIFEDLWDLKSAEIGVVVEMPGVADDASADEAGPTKRARTSAKSADAGSQK